MSESVRRSQNLQSHCVDVVARVCLDSVINGLILTESCCIFIHHAQIIRRLFFIKLSDSIYFLNHFKNLFITLIQNFNIHNPRFGSANVEHLSIEVAYIYLKNSVERAKTLNITNSEP